MSGDVQPRKRKDKRRKKEGGSMGAIYEPELIHRHKKSEGDHKSFESPEQGEKIHVQNEHGIGGNICVKIIFFCLFGLLLGAVGLIYLHSQGSTDVDLPAVEESRFAEYFTGWLDDSTDDHEHEAPEQDLDNEHDEHDDEEHEDDDNDDDHEKEDQGAEEQDSIFKLFGLQVDEEKEEAEESKMTTSDAQESEESGNKYDKDEDLEDEQEDEDDEEGYEDEQDSGVEKDEDDDLSQVDENNENDEDERDGEKEVSEEPEENEEEETNDDDLGYDEIYESEEDKEEEEAKEEEVEKEKATIVVVESSMEGEEEPESGGVAIKLGVGIALVIVAHLVLVQKWKSMSNASTNETDPSEIKFVTEEKKNVKAESEPVISRRQTLIPEDTYANDGWEEQEEEEELEESYSEEDEQVEEEEIEKRKEKNLEAFEKLSWDDEKEVTEKEDFEENAYDDEEEEYEGEEEEEEEEYEDDIEEEVESEYEDKEKKVRVEETEDLPREEEVNAEKTTPIPPPRAHKGGRGPEDFDEDSVERFEELNEVEDVSQEDVKGGEAQSTAEPERPKPNDAKPGNEDNWSFKQEFDFADEQFENNPKAAVQAYDKILTKKPTAVRALIGRARALDHLAEKEKSNAYLKQAINAYKFLLLERGHLLDDETYVKLSERCIERIRFSGAFNSAIAIHKALITKFPQTPKYRNALAVTYLMLNRIPQAKALLNETLALWPEDGFALAHYGFILKTSDNNMEEGAKKLMAGIETKQEGVIDGMFFFHLGDALNRLGRAEEAMKWYEIGVKEGLFLSKYQRSLYNVNRLKGQAWWTKEETTYQDFFRKLEHNWREIRREGLELLNSKKANLFKEEAENLKDTGDWKQLDLYFRGKKQTTCNKAPITCGLVSSFKPASTCTRGQVKFSVMLPDTHVWPHCGPTNCRLRSHLGLVVPKKTYIRVAEETRSWEEGKFIIFDDSFEHEVWHNGTGLRLVLIVDVWHPELTDRERLTLSPI